METNNKTAPVTQEKDQNVISLDLMNRMKLHGMAAAFRESLQSTIAETMTADGFLSLLLAREWDYRSDASIQRLIRQAGFRYKAYLENIDYTINRSLDRNHIERLSSLDFIRQGKNLFITGSSGTGKSYIGLQLALDNNQSQGIYLAPLKGIFEHLHEIISNDSNVEPRTKRLPGYSQIS